MNKYIKLLLLSLIFIIPLHGGRGRGKRGLRVKKVDRPKAFDEASVDVMILKSTPTNDAENEEFAINIADAKVCSPMFNRHIQKSNKKTDIYFQLQCGAEAAKLMSTMIRVISLVLPDEVLIGLLNDYSPEVIGEFLVESERIKCRFSDHLNHVICQMYGGIEHGGQTINFYTMQLAKELSIEEPLAQGMFAKMSSEISDLNALAQTIKTIMKENGVKDLFFIKEPNNELSLICQHINGQNVKALSIRGESITTQYVHDCLYYIVKEEGRYELGVIVIDYNGRVNLRILNVFKNSHVVEFGPNNLHVIERESKHNAWTVYTIDKTPGNLVANFKSSAKRVEFSENGKFLIEKNPLDKNTQVLKFPDPFTRAITERMWKFTKGKWEPLKKVKYLSMNNCRNNSVTIIPGIFGNIIPSLGGGHIRTFNVELKIDANAELRSIKYIHLIGQKKGDPKYEYMLCHPDPVTKEVEAPTQALCDVFNGKYSSGTQGNPNPNGTYIYEIRDTWQIILTYPDNTKATWIYNKTDEKWVSK